MIEQPEVVVASEVKTAAESAVKQACTLISGLLHDCQFSSVENKNGRGLIQEETLLSTLPEINWMKHCSFGSSDQNILLYPGLFPYCCPLWQCIVVIWKPAAYLKKLGKCAKKV